VSRRGSRAPGDVPAAPGVLLRALRAAGEHARTVFRLLAATAVLVLLLLDGEGTGTTGAIVVLAAAALYAALSAVAAWPRSSPPARGHRPDVVRAVLDVVTVCAVALAVREPRVAILLALCGIPLGYGLTLPARTVAGLAAAAIAGVTAVWATGPVLGARGIPGDAFVLLVLALLWCGLVAVLIAVERQRRAARIHRLSASVRDMLRQTVRAEANERGRVADLLHDDVLQLLLAARHDVSDAIDGELDLLPDARAGLEAATRRLRGTIAALRDTDGDEEPLGEALGALAARPADGRGAAVDVDVDDALRGVQHPVLVAAVRDVLRDAEGSNAARRVAISVARDEDHVVVTVAHEDRRLHLGLGPTAETERTMDDVAARVHALDGRLDDAHGADGGRVVTLRLPVRCDRPAPEEGPAAPVDERVDGVAPDAR
jgi:signal transduction histidine kinase